MKPKAAGRAESSNSRQSKMQIVWRCSLFFAWGLLGGCASTHYPINPPLARIDTEQGYRAQRFFATEPDDKFFMHVAISGGGARAAALGYGVLEALHDMPIRWEGRDKRFLDEVDVLMGVSGGSMLAAWFALHGSDDLRRFETEFLQTQLQGDLLSLALSPRNLWRIQSPRFGRGDLLGEYLDTRLYKGATFATLSSRPRKPYTIIYASDMSSGTRFEFVQEQFDYLCSDLDGVPLARAVSASSAAPLVLSPITFWNYAPADGAQGCGHPPNLSDAGAPAAGIASERRFDLETFRATTPDGLLRPFVHLLDGGLSDNVGARGPMDYIAQYGGVIAGTKAAGYRGVRRTVFIIVNAETSARPKEDRSADVPGPLRAALALADIPINRVSGMSLAAKRNMLEAWREEVRQAHARGEYDIFAADARFYLIEVNLGDEADPKLREQLLAIPTTLQLPASEVELLRRHAARTLYRSPDLRRLMVELKSETLDRSD